MNIIAAGVEERLTMIRGRIAAACERSGRDPAGVVLIGAAKTMPLASVKGALAAGLGDLGENTVQEARTVKEALAGDSAMATWHLIGHLQTNKVRDALRLFDVIHSVDSLRLGQHISERAATSVRVLLEVNVAAEPSKFGFSPEEVATAVAGIASLRHLDLQGLMTVAPATSDPEEVRPVFQTLRELGNANGLKQLSMGMTDDFEVAIEEGATIVRIGRAVFER